MSTPGTSIEALFADAEAELTAALNKSIDDIERVNDRHPQKALDGCIGTTTKETSRSVRDTTATNSSDVAYHDNDVNGDNTCTGGYSSFDDNDDDELSLDGEIENLEGLAMEDLVRELQDLESTLASLENTAGGYNGKQGTTRRDPFEGRGRRARKRRARIKREMLAREERAKAKAKANALRGGTGGDAKKPLKSLGSTSSLGRALAASQATSFKSDNKQRSNRGQVGGTKKGENITNPPKNNHSVEIGQPFQGRGRRARARRAKERQEKSAEQAEDAPKIGTRDAIVDKNEEEGKGEVTTTKKENDSVVAEVLKRNEFPDFSLRDALS